MLVTIAVGESIPRASYRAGENTEPQDDGYKINALDKPEYAARRGKKANHHADSAKLSAGPS